MDKEYKKVKKMYLVCEHCKASNEKVKVYNTYHIILCTKCHTKLKNGYLTIEDDNKITENISLNTKPSYKEPEYNEEGKIICNECGKFFSCLGNHLRHSHNMDTTEYRQKYNYNRKTKLISKDYYEHCSKRMAGVDMEKQLKKIFHIKRRKKQELLEQINMDDYKL